MIPIAIVTQKKDGRPAYLYFKTDSNTIQFDIYRSGSRRSVAYVLDVYNKARELLTWAMSKSIISPNIGSLLRAFDLPEIRSDVQILDVGIPTIQSLDTTEKDAKLCEDLSNRIQNLQYSPYQLILGRAQNAYYGLEKSKLKLNYATVEPKWSLETFSGRSKSLEFNVQGWSYPDKIYQESIPYNCALLHFDWICADFRAASILSQDNNLIESFKHSDPYSYLSLCLSGDKETLRDEAKLLLLKTVNSLDHDNEYVKTAYPQMCNWLCDLLNNIRSTGKSYNIVGRQFRLSTERNEKSLLNAVLQGSVASAMQSVIWKIRQVYPNNIVCDIHDGLVLAVEKDPKRIQRIIDDVSEIFSRPFFGIIQNDPFFPFRISLGEFWKQWNVIKEVRLK